MEKIKIGSDFSGVGAFNQALIRLGINYEEIFACDMDKYARQTFELNFGPVKYFPKDVYEREIPEESLDIYMTSPPCQAFSLAGKRKGEEDKRGILFYNSHEFIIKNKPRYFIIENVKGLLSDDSGKTFQRWIDYLAGKSVNGNPVIFPHEEAAPYHVYYQVLNAKHYGVPQNRERIFIIGIRDDEDNNFSFPKPFPLQKRLKDVLESEVDEKYFLSEKMVENITYSKKSNGEVANLNKGGERGSVYSEDTEAMSCLSATDYKQPKQIQIGTWRTHEDGKGFRPTEDNNCPTIPARAREDGSGQPVIKFGYGRKALNETLKSNKIPKEICIVDSYNKKIQEKVSPSILTTIDSACNHHVIIPTNNSKGFDLAEEEEEEDSINFSNPNSETRRGRVGKKVSQTLDTGCQQGIYTQ
jgi:DNA (cytosine-5)-methyltransferase 1